MKKFLQQIRSCENCIHFLPCPPRPIIQAGVAAKILIIGQAPGAKVQASGIPWDDASGNELRRWLGVDKEQFYNPHLFALMPMGFCYPGKGKSGDNPPRPECAPLWHNKVLAKLKNVQLTLLIGQYAHDYYLLNNSNVTLTDTVKNYKKFLPEFLPLVHPSPRNRIWQKKNPWFEKKMVPYLQEVTKEYL
jgi:uracil-DNA glycosylase